MILRLALADVLHERKMAICYAVAMAAVLAPLMVLYGLKHGVVTALTEELRQDPRNREVLVLGNRAYEPDWLEALAARPEVGFLAPRTRSIAATIDVEAPDDRFTTERAELIPTGIGDPLLDPGRTPPTGSEVAISRALAEAMGVGEGDRLIGRAIRQVGSARQSVTVDLQVAQVLDPASYQRKAVLAPIPLLTAVEDYRDGYAVPALGWAGEPPRQGPRSFASFRIYATTLEDVGPLVDHLTRLGVDVRSQAAEIETVRLLDRNLTQIFAIIAALGGLGYLLSLGANLWSNVERKHKELSIMRLLGVSAAGLVRFPIYQAVLIAGVGCLMAFAVYFMAGTTINLLFAAPVISGQRVCQLLPWHFAVAAAATAAAAVLASAVAGWQASRVEPAEGMRDV